MTWEQVKLAALELNREGRLLLLDELTQSLLSDTEQQQLDSEAASESERRLERHRADPSSSLTQDQFNQFVDSLRQ